MGYELMMGGLWIWDIDFTFFLFFFFWRLILSERYGTDGRNGVFSAFGCCGLLFACFGRFVGLFVGGFWSRYLRLLLLSFWTMTGIHV